MWRGLAVNGGLHDPRRALELPHHGFAVTVRDAGVDGSRADVAVAEMVLNELERGAGIEQVRGDRMPERVRRQARGEPGRIAVADEARLNLPTLERAVAAREERVAFGARRDREVVTQELRGRSEDDLLAPRAALEAANEQPPALKVDIPTADEEHFSHAQPVVIHEREERPVTRVANDREEAPDLILGQVARESLVWQGLNGQRGKKRDRRPTVTARNSRRAQSTAGDPRRPVNTGGFGTVTGSPEP